MGGGGEVTVGERSFYTRDDECVVNSKVCCWYRCRLASHTGVTKGGKKIRYLFV